MCVYMCQCACLCPSQAIPQKLLNTSSSNGMVTASNIVMHHMLIILTLTFIQGHTYRNHSNNKCLIDSETLKAIPTTFCCEDSLDNLFSVQWPCSSPRVTTSSQTWQMLNLYYNSHPYLRHYLNYDIQTWHDSAHWCTWGEILYE